MYKLILILIIIYLIYLLNSSDIKEAFDSTINTNTSIKLISDASIQLSSSNRELEINKAVNINGNIY